MLDKKIFLKGMAILAAVYPERNCDKETTGAYWEFLKDFNTHDFERVIKSYINQSKYFPKICELREELVRLKEFNRPTATDEWERLIRAAEEGKEPPMESKTEKALRVCGGWGGFIRMTYRDLQFHRKDFERIYNKLLEIEDKKLKISYQGTAQKQIEDLNE